ncbi:MAG: DUF5689 domain-containing protein [Bacteroidales bacterium]
MKAIKYLATLFTASTLIMGGCNDDYDVPPLDIPESSIDANTTILDLKTAFQANLDTITLRPDGEDYIIKGTVIGNDVSGNIYKNLIIQDATAALTIAINSSGLYTNYRVGQELVINCTGLYIGKYAKLQQMGYPASGGKQETTFMPLAAFEKATQLNGLPGNNFDTLQVTIASLPTTNAGLMQYQSQLVEFKDVTFEGGGTLTFANASSSATRYIVDADGNKLAVRNSNFSDFATDTLPAGKGNVIGILSYFNSYQLLLRSRSDVYGFTNP